MLTEGKPHGGKEPYVKQKIIVIFPGRTRLLRIPLDIGDLTDPNTGFNKSRVRECPTPSFHSYFTMFACQFRSAVFSSSGSWALLQNLVIKGIPRIIITKWRRPGGVCSPTANAHYPLWGCRCVRNWIAHGVDNSKHLMCKWKAAPA